MKGERVLEVEPQAKSRQRSLLGWGMTPAITTRSFRKLWSLRNNYPESEGSVKFQIRSMSGGSGTSDGNEFFNHLLISY
ncbi:MAG: hypothetical protein JJU28_15525 [Cyclobacteriaceae bacterium]|nr:hypothetical protein [Cyclobacteriaceae bacterium]